MRRQGRCDFTPTLLYADTTLRRCYFTHGERELVAPGLANRVRARVRVRVRDRVRVGVRVKVGVRIGVRVARCAFSTVA